MIHSQRQVQKLQKKLGSKYTVVLGLAYAKPSIADAVSTLERKEIRRIIVLPLFPQFSTTTTASTYDEIFFSALGRNKKGVDIQKKYVPTLRFVEPYYDNDLYISAVCAAIKKNLRTLKKKPDKFILSFHGIPKRYVKEGDPYPAHCEETASRIAKHMKWKRRQWALTYQSRFGKEEWLKPYTQELLPKLYKQGVKRPFVVAPGFVSDCLETLHELGIEGRDLYAEGGGNASEFTLAPCLNDSEEWIRCMTHLVKTNSGGWA